MRIVSLLASGTEIVCGLGAGKDLVGRSHECDNPDWIKRLPVCTWPAFDVEMSSRAINAEVSRRIRANEPLYYIDAELIARLDPDLLITQEHCDVCAVTPRDVARDGCQDLTRQVLALSAGTVRGIMTEYLRWGKRLIVLPPQEVSLLTFSRISTTSIERLGENPRRLCSCWNGLIQFSRWATGDRNWSRPPMGSCC